MINTTGGNWRWTDGPPYYVSKTYVQCGGTVGPGGSQCNKCGANIGSGGTCFGMIEIISRKEAIEAQREKI